MFSAGGLITSHVYTRTVHESYVITQQLYAMDNQRKSWINEIIHETCTKPISLYLMYTVYFTILLTCIAGMKECDQLRRRRSWHSCGEVSCDKEGKKPVTAVIGSAVTDWGKNPVTAVIGSAVTDCVWGQVRWWGQLWQRRNESCHSCDWLSCNRLRRKETCHSCGGDRCDRGGKNPVTVVVGTEVTEEERILSQLWWEQMWQRRKESCNSCGGDRCAVAPFPHWSTIVMGATL